MSEIKRGDLVMVVKPTLCCGNPETVGRTFIAGQLWRKDIECHHCGHVYQNVAFVEDIAAGHYVGRILRRLKKLDPPATGETREAYRNLKLPKKVTA